jgi:hypothetical protein
MKTNELVAILKRKKERERERKGEIEWDRVSEYHP